MNEELKRKIHEIIEAHTDDRMSYSVVCWPRELERLIFEALDGLPTSADLDAEAQERRIAEETK
jgi:hypothetical protein